MPLHLSIGFDKVEHPFSPSWRWPDKIVEKNESLVLTRPLGSMFKQS